MSNTARGIVIGTIAALLGSILFFFFQDYWRDRASLLIEIVPSEQFSPKVEGSADRDAERTSKLIVSLGDKLSEWDRTGMQDVVRAAKAYNLSSSFSCAYEVEINNGGSLPAEDVFVLIPDALVSTNSSTYHAYDPAALVPTKLGAVTVGEIKQGGSARLLVLSGSSCEYSGSKITAGHKLGSAKVRYFKFPTILPTFVLDYPGITFFILLLVFLAAVFAVLSIFGTVLSSLFSRDENSLDVKGKAKEEAKSASQATKKGKQR